MVTSADMTQRFWTNEKLDRLEMLHCVMGLDLDDIARDLQTTPKAAWHQINFMGLRRTMQGVQARRERGISCKRWDTPERDYPNKAMRAW